MIDTLDLLLIVIVTAASAQDRNIGQAMLIDVQAKTQRLQKVYADQGSTQWLVEWIVKWKQCMLEITTKSPEQQGFQIQPKRWIVECCFAWFRNYRRLSKEHGRLVASSEGMIRIVFMRLMARKLANYDSKIILKQLLI